MLCVGEKPQSLINESSMGLLVHADIGNARLLHDSRNVAKHNGKQMETLPQNVEKDPEMEPKTLGSE